MARVYGREQRHEPRRLIRGIGGQTTKHTLTLQYMVKKTAQNKQGEYKEGRWHSAELATESLFGRTQIVALFILVS